ncbi:hypothetical protein CRG98_022771 [Punica granatum]|uniref:Uncharacterized protein n=1 Tax=Punica granatum TaxID=22663 RepID=A0A2I0JLM1_PUNGR|nr:hypothetical protein CRG98_022771 [Punica granatum]
MTMRLMHTSLEVGLVKRELMHKILEACMFQVGQSHGRRPDKSNKLWRACSWVNSDIRPYAQASAAHARVRPLLQTLARDSLRPLVAPNCYSYSSQ